MLTILLLLACTDTFKAIENLTINQRFKLRAPFDSLSDPRILLISIDQGSLEKLGRWPWSRKVHANFLNLLSLRPPSVVAFDLFFPEEESAEMDTKFASGLALHPKAITGATSNPEPSKTFKNPPSDTFGLTQPLIRIFGDRSAITGADYTLLPIEPLRKNAHFAFVNSDPNRVDGMRRRVPLIVRHGQDVYPSLSLQCLMLHFDKKPNDVEIVLGQSIILETSQGKLQIPINEAGEMWINYRNQDFFKGYSYYKLMGDLLKLHKNPDLEWSQNLPILDGQMLIVGQTAEGLTDFGPTPLNPITPLPLVHMNALNNMLKNDFLIIAPAWPFAIGWLLITWGTLFWLREKSLKLFLGVPFIIAFIYISLGCWCFYQFSYEIPLVWPVAGFAVLHAGSHIHHWIQTIRSRSRIKGMFGNYLAPELVERMISSGEEPQLGGRKQEITAFFSDVVSFSTFSEKLVPEDLALLMNEYMGEMTDILQEEGGSLDKYIGDAIVAMFGAPLELKGHAYYACVTTLRMLDRLRELRKKWSSEPKWPEVVGHMQMRIGLNTGTAIVGNFGSKKRFNYTMMGDMVNLAARCESAGKVYGVFNLVSEYTMDAARQHKDDLAFRYLDKIVVKGRIQPVAIYEIMGYKNQLSENTANCLQIFEKGIAAYLKENWDGAIKHFQESAPLEPNLTWATTTPSRVMIERCEYMKEHPPGADWDGVYTMKSK